MTYDVLLLDPPWSYYGSTNGWGDAAKFYSLMSDEDIFALDIQSRLAKRAVVFVWATCPKLDVAIHAIERWGLHYRGVGFVWVKTKLDGTPIGAQGVRPSVVKPLTELVLVCSNVATGRPLPLSDESVCQTVFSPKQEHSRKPDEVQERIERMYPETKRLELFARRHRPGWDCEGNEVDGPLQPGAILTGESG